ncbi:MAG: 2-oxoacid:acceptor oxidoreductase subunit alpha [Pseudomonadota bacterium]|nr:2-oxoacid:acceptor oxidoreductase subunit alpha [Pseudomonadota bacterium]MEE3286813.1 2-oxoacid:acceptor oxidoreductase subunit alpha [Pseudomonadota bacterium]
MNRRRPRLEDLSIIVSGQGGDGSLTVINILADVLRSVGLRAYTERDVLSRIKGGIVAATLRACREERLGIGSQIDLIVAFDVAAIRKESHRLNDRSIVIYDDSGGALADDSGVPEGARVIGIPFSRHAVRTFSRDIYKNSISSAVVGRLIGLSDGDMRNAFEKRFSRRGAQALKYNLDALAVGHKLADNVGLTADEGLYEIVSGNSKPHMLITGNEAVAFGFAVAGGRFFAGYPITPSTDIMEWLEKWLPKFGGVVRQAEDELSVINMGIGAALTGTRTMVATSGPGLALMQEGIGQLGMAEIPLVVVDAQRSGPSTGMPTKPEQSDLNLLVYGGHGDFPRVVLAPGTPEECFYLTVKACNLAEKYQVPVFIALDQGLSQNLATIELIDQSQVVVERGKRLDSESLAELPVYKRYAFSEDGVSAFAVPGTPGGMSLVTGNEHDEFGQVSTDPDNRTRMVHKRQSKVQAMQPDLPCAITHGTKTAEIGFIGIGMTHGVILEAIEILAERGFSAQYHQLQTLWPMLEETPAFTRDCPCVFVVEYNSTKQLAKLIIAHGGEDAHIENVLVYDGVPLRAVDLVQKVIERLETRGDKVA